MTALRQMMIDPLGFFLHKNHSWLQAQQFVIIFSFGLNGTSNSEKFLDCEKCPDIAL